MLHIIDLLKQIPTRSNAFLVASFVVTLPKTVVKPKISSPGVWNAIKMAMLSSVNKQNPPQNLSHYEKYVTIHKQNNSFW